jgi:hypothetical protein
MILGSRVFKRAFVVASCSARRAGDFQPLGNRPRLAPGRKACFSSERRSNGDNLISVMDSRFIIDWKDRIGLQNAWSLPEKGWQVEVDWRPTPFGAGLFACQEIPKDTLLRVGSNGRNLIPFRSIADIEEFCQGDKDLLAYVADYLWGFDPVTDDGGYEFDPRPIDAPPRFFGMWVPGNGLNHSPAPNTVYRPASGGTDEGIHLVALADISEGDELVDDYRRHGRAPQWLLEFGEKYQVSLNFAECNDFVDSQQ